jgi:chemotaxis family two-component system response regulator Rcp1
MVESGREKLVILLVEDNAGDVYLVREALEEAGFPHILHVACDGYEAIDFLHAQAAGGDAWPDLMILDLNLPGKNGREVMAEMQIEPALKRLPVAVLSTSRSECHIGRDFPQLRSTFAAKTPDFKDLVDIVRRFKDFADGYNQIGATLG